ncbi:MAG: hypothetical protein NDI82_03890 [Anaeromyxobacteraceae bacterium]|nr:hypothetical protein [Anaeromyxobacteraceae bacterium]
MPSGSPLVGLGSPRPAGGAGGGLVGLGGRGGGPGGGPGGPGGGEPARRDRWAWLRSQGLGLVCGFGTVVLLAIGSVVMVRTRDGASAGIGLDDLTPFFTRPSPAHLWLYLLFPLAALYALNTTLATLDNVRRRWRAGQRSPAAYAIAVVHLGFLLALVAHGVGGFRSEERGAVVLHSGWQAVPGFGDARLAALEVDELPGGMPREVRAAVEWRREGGAVEQAMVGYNQPLSDGLGARLALLQEFGRVPVARLSSRGERCVLTEGQRCSVGGEVVQLLRLAGLPGGGGSALVRVGDGASQDRWLGLGDLLALRTGQPLSLDAVDVEPAVLLRVRETPGNPWALAAAAALGLGTLLMWRRLVPRPAAPEPQAAAEAGR